MDVMGWLTWAGAAVATIGSIVAYKLAFGAASDSSTFSTDGGKPPPWWTAADYRALYATAGRLRMNAADLLLVLASESGLNPAASYPGGFAVGLNQLTSASDGLTGLNETQRANVVKMSVAEQIPIIERMFRGIAWTKTGKGYPTAGVIYAQNFLPSRAMLRGAAPDTVLGTVKEFPPDAGLADEKGNYTVRSLETHLRKVAGQATYKGALQEMREATGDRALSPRLAA